MYLLRDKDKRNEMSEYREHAAGPVNFRSLFNSYDLVTL